MLVLISVCIPSHSSLFPLNPNKIQYATKSPFQTLSKFFIGGDGYGKTFMQISTSQIVNATGRLSENKASPLSSPYGQCQQPCCFFCLVGMASLSGYVDKQVFRTQIYSQISEETLQRIL